MVSMLLCKQIFCVPVNLASLSARNNYLGLFLVCLLLQIGLLECLTCLLWLWKKHFLCFMRVCVGVVSVHANWLVEIGCPAFHPTNWIISRKRAAPGIEPGTSRTRSENHTTRPSSQLRSQKPKTEMHYDFIGLLIARFLCNYSTGPQMRAERFELPTFWSGVRRATVAPYPRWKCKCHVRFLFCTWACNWNCFKHQSWLGPNITDVFSQGRWARASCGIRTHDLPLTERVLCQLS